MSVYDDKSEDEIRNILQIYGQNHEKRTGRKLNVAELKSLLNIEADRRDKEFFERAFQHFTSNSLRLAAKVLEKV